MKPGIPWSVKGVEPELREVAKSAARRSGMTLGEWLNSAINEQAEMAGTEEPGVAAPRPTRSSLISTHPIERAATKLEDIAAQLSRLAARESDSALRAPAPSVDEQLAMAKVLSRIESNEKQTVEAFSAVNERLATISRQITRGNTAPAKIEEAPSFQALEKAVRNIVEHLEVSDRRTRENMKSLQERMSDMATRATASGSEQMLRQAPAFSQLENRLTELAQRMEQSSSSAAAPAATDQLREELSQLANRIETVRETAESLAARAQTEAVQVAQAELRNIEQRIAGLLNEAKQSISSQHVGPAELQRFRHEIDRLNARIDESAKAAGANPEVSALRVAVEQLSTRVAQGQDPRPLAELDRRVLDIARKVEETEAATRSLPQMNDLEQRFAELEQRLQQSLASPSPQGQEELTQKLVEVDERLARTEHQLGHLETIERAITQLYDAIEQNRKAAHEVAHEVASRVAQDFAAQAATGSAAPALADAPEIMALQSGLKAVREASEAADSRNQETLEAVHETLEQIVAKLTELETAAIGQRVAQAAHPAAAMPTPDFAAPPAPAAMPDPLAQAPMPRPEPVFQPDAPTGNFMDPIFASANLETPVAETAPAEDPAAGNPFASASPASLNAAAPATEEMGVNDWVAAARSLAQSGAEAKNPISGFKPGNEKKAKPAAKGLNLPFLSRFKGGAKTKPAATPAAPLNPPKSANANQPQSKSRLVVLGLVLLSLAVFATTNYMGRIHQQMAPAPQATEEQAPAAAPAAPQPDTAPLAQPEGAKAASPQQQGDAGSTASPEADPILTGALPAAKAPAEDGVGMAKPIQSASASASVAAVTIEPAVGPAKLRQAAEGGDATAQFIVASHYLNGDSVPTDFAKAAYWYGKAAVQGLAPAQYRLGTLYERGRGVDKNLAAALSWYERAGTAGNVKAMHNAAVIAAGNENGQPDYAKAVKWFSLAAGHGLKDSQYNLAVLIERGLGTKQDSTEALFWYMAAAAQSDTDAQARVVLLSKSLSAATVEAVKARFKAWTPDKAPEAANSVAANDAQWNPPAGAQQSSVQPANLNDQAKSLLDKLGYRVGAMDGGMDAKTANAIKLFQIQQGLKVTGQATPELISAMQAKVG